MPEYCLERLCRLWQRAPAAVLLQGHHGHAFLRLRECIRDSHHRTQSSCMQDDNQVSVPTQSRAQPMIDSPAHAQNDLQAAANTKLTLEQKTEKLARLRKEMGDAAWEQVKPATAAACLARLQTHSCLSASSMLGKTRLLSCLLLGPIQHALMLAQARPRCTSCWCNL